MPASGSVREKGRAGFPISKLFGFHNGAERSRCHEGHCHLSKGINTDSSAPALQEVAVAGGVCRIAERLNLAQVSLIGGRSSRDTSLHGGTPRQQDVPQGFLFYHRPCQSRESVVDRPSSPSFHLRNFYDSTSPLLPPPPLERRIHRLVRSVLIERTQYPYILCNVYLFRSK